MGKEGDKLRFLFSVDERGRRGVGGGLIGAGRSKVVVVVD